MQEKRENTYRINAICPKCGELLEIKIDISTSLIEVPKEPETEEKDNVETLNNRNHDGTKSESADVRPDSGT